MRKIIVFLIVLLSFSNAFAQYVSQPSVGSYTSSIYSSESGSCGYFHGKDMLKFKITKINGNKITFKAIKYDNGNYGKFKNGTRLYIKWSSNNNYKSLVCSGFEKLKRSSSGSYYYGTFTFNFTGTRYFIVTSKANNSEQTRYYSRYIKITKKEKPTTPSNPSPSNYQNNVSTSLRLSWSSYLSGGSVGYDLYIGEVGKSKTKYTGQGTYRNVTGLKQGTTYEWHVISYGSNGTNVMGPKWRFSTKEKKKSITVIRPEAYSSHMAGKNMVVTWTSTGSVDNVIIAIGSKSTQDAMTTKATKNDGHAVISIPSSWKPANDYKLIIQERNGSAKGTVEHITISKPCEKPTGLGAKNITSNSFVAYWNYVNGADHYMLSLYKNGSWVNEYSINRDNEIEITGLEPNTSYVFRVKAECGDDNWSDDGISNIITTKKDETTACGFPDCTSGNCGNLGNEAFEAIKYLCEKGIVTGDAATGNVYPDNNITRAQLAAIAYRGLFGDKTQTVASNFPSPYYDLQDKTAYYYEHAKALLYLEYEDGITPFNRTYANFYPNKKITRASVLKVLLETYNIKPNTGGSSPFTDVSKSDSYYGYVRAAADKGIINTNHSKFKPNSLCTRAHAFIMLSRILKKGYIPTVNGKKDFFVPGNMTPYNIAVEKGLDVGNFNHYTKNCFNIVNRGIPMDFSFTYNSFPTELPSDFYPMQPLGYAWTHSYNAYAKVILGYGKLKNRLLIHWPNGTLNIYKVENNKLVSVTQGLHDKVNMQVEGKTITLLVTTKSQIKYHFTTIPNVENLMVLDRIEDRHNNYVKIYYEIGADEKPRIDYVKDQFGRKLTFYYHSGTNHLRKVTDPLGRSISFEFDNGKLSEFTDAESHKTVYNYRNKKGEENLLTTIKLPKGNTISNSYFQRKLTSTQYNDNAPTKIKVEPNYAGSSADGYISSTVKTLNTQGDTIRTHYRRDGNNNLRYVKNDITEATIEYNDANPTLPTKITQNDNIMTTMKYDNNGNVTQVTVSGGGKTITKSYTYNNYNDLTSYTDGNGNSYSFTYSNGNMTRATTPIATTKLDYNSHGQVTLVTSPENIKVRYDYGDYGYLTQTQVVGSQIKTSYTYDKIGRVKTVTNAKGNTVTYDYNNVDAITAVTNPLSERTRYGFDRNDNLTSVTNAKGNATTMTYDDEDLLRTVSFAGSTKQFTYYYDGSLKTLIKPNGQSFSYEYDAMGRFKTDGSTTYKYEQEKLKSITYNGKSITYGYDGLHRINSIRYSDMSNNEVRYEYDNNSNITAITYPGGKKVRYTYDAGNRMKTVTDWNNHTTKYDYRDDGLLEQTTYPNKVVTEYRYDKFGRLKEQRTTRQDGSVIAEYTFELDDLGNHIKENLTQPQEVIPQVPNGTTTYTYDNGNHLQTAGNSSYSFDKNGDIENGNGYNYTFNKYGKLTQISGKLNASYEYDGLGNRRKRNNTRYFLDIMGLSRVLAETNGNSVQHYYVYGLGLISRIDKSNNTNYYVYDFRGSTVAITDDSYSANITHKYAYDDFGKITAEQEANANPFKYVGKMGLMYEDENHYFVRARYYDCNTARFLSEDPIWNTNLYAYAGNNGVMNVDVNGKFAITGAFSGAIWGGITELPGAIYDGGSSFVDAYNGFKYAFKGDYVASNYYFDKAEKKAWGANKNIIKGMLKGGISGFSKGAKIAVKVYEFSNESYNTYKETGSYTKAIMAGAVKVGVDQIEVKGIKINKIKGSIKATSEIITKYSQDAVEYVLDDIINDGR